MPDFFPAAVFVLCILTSGGCALVLARSYIRSRRRLMMWSALCFTFLTLNNIVLFLEGTGIVAADLAYVRASLSLAAVAVLLFGFIWDLDQ